MDAEAALGDDAAEASGAGRAAARKANAVAVLCIGLLLVAAFAIHAGWMLQNHDNDWYLTAALRFARGGRYGTDFVDPNPPLILMLMAPPALLADWFGAEPYTIFSLYVCALVLASVGLARAPLTSFLRDTPAGARLLLVAYAAILALDPGYEFGQREHLFVILFCPGLFWLAARDAGDARRFPISGIVAVGLAAVAVLIKPYFLLVPLALLLLRAGRRRGWRTVLDGPALTVAGLAAVYTAFVVFAYPDYLTEAAIQAQGYFAWNRSWLTVVRASQNALAALALAAALAELAPVAPRMRTLLRTLSVAAVAAMVFALYQKKAWAYHLLPAVELAEIALAGVAASLLPRLARRPWVRAPEAVVCLAILVEAGVLAQRPVENMIGFARAAVAADPLVAALRTSFRGQSVMLLTSGSLEGYPSLAGVRIGASEPSQVLLPGAVRLASGSAAERERAPALRNLAIAAATADLTRYRPDVVAVDRRAEKQALPDDFDVLAFYRADPRFAEAWSAYRLATQVAGWDLYTRAGG